jgi:hypothetical protein
MLAGIAPPPMTGAGARRMALLALLAAALGPAPALAQESPELPPRGFSGEQPQTLFYKGKGPGRGNSYVARFEEDYAYRRNPANATDPFDLFKFIPLDPRGDAYLTLNGEVRFRFDDTSWRNFGIATAAAPTKQTGGLPMLTPQAQARDNRLLKQRYALGADLHLSDNIRLRRPLPPAADRPQCRSGDPR